MPLVPSQCSARCERWQQKQYCTTWLLFCCVVRLFICPVWKQFISSASVNVSVFIVPHTYFRNVTLRRVHCYGNDSGTQAFSNNNSLSARRVILAVVEHSVTCIVSVKWRRTRQLRACLRPSPLQGETLLFSIILLLFCLRWMGAATQGVCASFKFSLQRTKVPLTERKIRIL